MKWLPMLLATALLAGCAQLDDARQTADDAAQALADAQREAQEARERYDRVKSATVVRTETVRLTVAAQANESGALWFEPTAARGDGAIPRENLSDLPDVRLAGAGWSFVCDPLSCRAELPAENVTLSWADGAPGEVVLRGGHGSCTPRQPTESFCLLDTLVREDAQVVVRTALGDVTE